MPDVPDQPVARRIENIVDRGGQLDHAQSGAEVATGRPDGGDRLLPQLVRQLAQLLGLQFSQLFRGVDGIEQRSLREFGHPTRLRASPSAVDWQREPASVAVGAAPPHLDHGTNRCTVRPQESHTRKMQSCRQSGCALAT
ncbi:hypothetical protein WR25_05758 [Diploscapter pachys]|uniref:Uncharacterized protein n=1 Tax=Diploscapter pachys TaxID=2018661 RepID=A0A2A2M5N6_9BILA|nr:hypothetical protein WR25_05758 [Diploscapter pachys]